MLPLLGPLSDFEQGGDGLDTDDFKGLDNLKLFDILGQVTASQPLMDVLVAREITKFFNPRLDVMPGDGLSLVDRFQADCALHALVGIDRVLRNIEPEIFLRTQHGNPVITLERDAPFRAPDSLHRLRCITGG